MRVVAFDPFVSAERYREHGRGEGRQPAGAVRERRLPHHPPAEDARHDGLPRRRRLRRHARRGARAERRPRRSDRRRRPQGRARLRQGRGRGARRVPAGADDREPAVRVSQRDRHPAPRRLHRGGDRPGRLPVRRAGGGRAHRWGRLDGRQHPCHRRRGHGGAGPVPAAGHTARSPGDDARGRQLGRADRGGLPRADRRVRHPPARPGRDRGRAAGTHRGAGERRQRPLDGRPARHRRTRRRWSPRRRTSTS